MRAEIHSRRLMTLTGLIELVFREDHDAGRPSRHRSSEDVSIFEISSAPNVGQGKGEAQFDSQGRDFLSWCLLAAAKNDGTMREVL